MLLPVVLVLAQNDHKGSDLNKAFNDHKGATTTTDVAFADHHAAATTTDHHGALLVGRPRRGPLGHGDCVKR